MEERASAIGHSCQRGHRSSSFLSRFKFDIWRGVAKRRPSTPGLKNKDVGLEPNREREVFDQGLITTSDEEDPKRPPGTPGLRIKDLGPKPKRDRQVFERGLPSTSDKEVLKGVRAPRSPKSKIWAQHRQEIVKFLIAIRREGAKRHPSTPVPGIKDLQQKQNKDHQVSDRDLSSTSAEKGAKKHPSTQGPRIKTWSGSLHDAI